jgi:hypothetical protein
MYFSPLISVQQALHIPLSSIRTPEKYLATSINYEAPHAIFSTLLLIPILGPNISLSTLFLNNLNVYKNYRPAICFHANKITVPTAARRLATASRFKLTAVVHRMSASNPSVTAKPGPKGGLAAHSRDQTSPPVGLSTWTGYPASHFTET